VKKGELLIWRKNGNFPHCALRRTSEVVAYSSGEVLQVLPMLSFDCLACMSSSGVVGIVDWVGNVVAQTVVVETPLGFVGTAEPNTAAVVAEGTASGCCCPLLKCP
jgi:hypothetical protein